MFYTKLKQTSFGISGEGQCTICIRIGFIGIAFQIETYYCTAFIQLRQKCNAFFLIICILSRQNDVVKRTELIDKILINTQFCCMEASTCFTLLFIWNLHHDLCIV